MTPANPLPLDATARAKLARLATETRDAWNAYAAAPDTAAGNDARVDYLALREDFKAACSPDVILALLAAVERGEAETARLDFMESLTDEVDQNICPPGHHGGVQSNWLLTHERQRAPFVREWQAPTLRAALDAARAHPPIQETDADA